MLADVTEWRVPDVMNEASCLKQVRVRTNRVSAGSIREQDREPPSKLRNLEAVRQPIVIATQLIGCNYLGLASESAELIAVQDPINIVLKGTAHVVQRRRALTTA
ncbi:MULTISPECIES: hypothetical protein [unclassified Nocardioides]|uniref:hypothetical protein n=1 Tax=unclassified Nocardioides TaxID=2615069 RepID=UPI00361038EE